MKFPGLLAILCAAFSFASCHRAAKPPAAVPQSADIPLMPVQSGDTWIYDVHLNIPEDVTSPGAAEVDENFQRTRTYLGKISPAAGLPAVDCLEVTVPGSPTEREFVDIFDDRILLRGSLILRPETTQPLWFAHPIPFIVAGMTPGTVSPEIATADSALTRTTQVIAREPVTVPAGTFPSIRLLMTGTDGRIELRRTIWFAPGTGIVQEEKTRYQNGKLLFRETQQLHQKLTR